MIIGIGTDIIEIDRIKKAVQSESFFQKCFTENERALFGNENYASLAGNFAVKEAVSKSFGTGISGFGLTDIETLRDEKGAPYVILYNGAKRIAKDLNIVKIHVSISHNKENATAFVVAEGGF